MMRQRTLVRRYGFWITAFYDVDCRDSEVILFKLRCIGMRGRQLEQARSNLESCSLNSGLTFFSPNYAEVVMVFGATTSGAELLDVFTHEVFHCATYVGASFGMSDKGEDKAYLAGAIAKSLYPCAKMYI